MIWLAYGAIVLIACVAFYLWWPAFGGRTPKATFSNSKNHNSRTFQNSQTTHMGFGFSGWVSFIRRQLKDSSARKPSRPLQALVPDFKAFESKSGLQVIWLGHSTVLARIDGQTILFDPVFSKRVSPFQWIGPKRFDTNPQAHIEDLPHIDAVVISHDHYDHLDYASIKKLAAKTDHFFMPLGIKAHLVRWGVSTENVIELDWWQETTYNNLTFVCTPAQHFSGRTLTDRAATLWGSWVVTSETKRVFFSGDGGYNTHFKQIGETYGPFDLTLLECGQYDPLWPDVHMMPEQTVQAHVDLRGKLMIPIHWGAFVLALHPWADSVKRALTAAKKSDSTVVIPQIGELVPVPPQKHILQWF